MSFRGGSGLKTGGSGASRGGGRSWRMLQATARVEDKGQGDKYRRKELLKKCMSMLRETGSHDVLVDRCCAILQNDVSEEFIGY